MRATIFQLRYRTTLISSSSSSEATVMTRAEALKACSKTIRLASSSSILTPEIVPLRNSSVSRNEELKSSSFAVPEAVPEFLGEVGGVRCQKQHEALEDATRSPRLP